MQIATKCYVEPLWLVCQLLVQLIIYEKLQNSNHKFLIIFLIHCFPPKKLLESWKLQPHSFQESKVSVLFKGIKTVCFV